MRYGLTSCVAAVALLALTGGAYQSVVTASFEVSSPSTELPAEVPGMTPFTDFESMIVIDAFDPAPTTKSNLVNTSGPHTAFAYNFNAIPTAIIFPEGSLSLAGGLSPPTPFGTFSHGVGTTANSVDTNTNGRSDTNTRVVPAVPEVSTWAMMVLGFAAVGFLAYRRRKSTNCVAQFVSPTRRQLQMDQL